MLSKIKIFGLGGLSESGKNSYVIEVDDEIYVFDAGIKFASGNLLGIDYIMPDFSYLVRNRKRIKGLFITHGHKENMGAVADLLKDIPELKVYATNFTKFELMEDGVSESNIIVIKPHKKINFGTVSIFPIAVAHSCPDAVMYVVNTKDGAICYTGDFIVDPSMQGSYDMDLGKIAYVGKQGVLCLMCESTFAEKNGHTSPKHRLVEYWKDIINHHDKRILFSVLPSHLYTIAEIFEAAANSHRKIVIMGKRLQNVVNFSKKEGYLDFNPEILGDLSNVNDDNAILLIMDDKTQPYANMNKILNNYDKFVTLKNTDTIVFAEPRYDSTEKILVKLQNELAMFGCDIETIPSDKEILHHASREDLMLMIKLINPKYYMPVKGEYRYMVNNANLASALHISDSNILLKQNGDVVTFVDGKLVDNFAKVKIDDVLIDGTSNDDIGDLVIKDREMLSENGIVLISATVDKHDKVLLVGPEVTTRGFIYVKDSQDMIKEIKNICEEIINRNITPTHVDFNQIKVEIREKLSDYLYQETECKPMIIAVVQEV
ncbi:MAG TPA: ribonuclease J [Candidatus Onthocola stercoravium]|nr:ribonuclease J [Candidatus Onthocola stercoravium]